MARRLSRDVSPDKRVKLERGTPSFFDKNDSFIPNNEGYLKISKIIIEKLEKY